MANLISVTSLIEKMKKHKFLPAIHTWHPDHWWRADHEPERLSPPGILVGLGVADGGVLHEVEDEDGLKIKRQFWSQCKAEKKNPTVMKSGEMTVQQ